MRLDQNWDLIMFFLGKGFLWKNLDKINLKHWHLRCPQHGKALQLVWFKRTKDWVWTWRNNFLKTFCCIEHKSYHEFTFGWHSNSKIAYIYFRAGTSLNNKNCSFSNIQLYFVLTWTLCGFFMAFIPLLKDCFQ